MIQFKKLTVLVGYLSLLLFLGVAAFLFFGFIERNIGTNTKIKFEVKEKAKGVNLWRITAQKKYHLIAEDMIKNKNGTIKLIQPILWIFQNNSSPIYIQSKIAYVYPNNNVKTIGNTIFKKNTLIIYGKNVEWINSRSILKSNNPFNGKNNKTTFKGNSFVYILKNSILEVRGINIWIK